MCQLIAISAMLRLKVSSNENSPADSPIREAPLSSFTPGHVVIVYLFSNTFGIKLHSVGVLVSDNRV